MLIHELKTLAKRKRKKRIGRGGKRGTTSGRGQKGQKSRAGRRLRPAERDLILKIPKRRGFKNKPVSSKPIVFNLSEVAKRMSFFLKEKNDASVVDTAFLKTIGMLPLAWRGIVKILGDGEISIPLTFIGLRVSKNAKTKIEKAGGHVVEAEGRGSKNKIIDADKRGKVTPRRSASKMNPVKSRDRYLSG